MGEEYDDDDCVEMNLKGGSAKVSSTGSKGSSSMPSKKIRQKGPLDVFFAPNPADVVKARKKQGRQKTINKLCRKELREKACGDIARWSIGQFGPRLKPPSMYELRVPFLKKGVEATEKAMVEHKKEWAHKGCST